MCGRCSWAAKDLIPAAKKWIEAQGDDFAGQKWDQKGYKIPGGTPSTPALAQNLPAFPANLRKQIKGANYPAPVNIMSAAVEGALVLTGTWTGHPEPTVLATVDAS